MDVCFNLVRRDGIIISENWLPPTGTQNVSLLLPLELVELNAQLGEKSSLNLNISQVLTLFVRYDNATQLRGLSIPAAIATRDEVDVFDYVYANSGR